MAVNIAVYCESALAGCFSAQAADAPHRIRIFHELRQTADVAAFRPDAVLLQCRREASALQDALVVLYREKLTPRLLVWERSAEGSIFCAESAGGCPELEELLSCALGGAALIRLTYPAENWTARFPEFSGELLRRETMKTILYGMPAGEFEAVCERYGLHLGQAGFYLFVWELDKTALTDYPVNKSIHYFLHMLRLEEFSRIIRADVDGEIIFSDISFAYILLNAPRCNSMAARRQQVDRVTRALAAVGGRESAYCFHSRSIPDCGEIPAAYREFQRTCAYRFFCREAAVLSSGYIEARQRPMQPEVIRGTVAAIQRLIRFEPEDGGLPEMIRRLYLDLIKPSMSYKLYYIASEELLTSLKEELALKPVVDAIDDPWLVLAAQFGSIEESCRRILDCIADMNRQQVKKHSVRSALISGAIRHIEENYHRQLTVMGIADDLGVTPAYLSQSFKRETGISIKKYLTSCRMQAAKRLLLTTDDPVSWVAAAAGYSDFRQFSKIFKALNGVSPTQYRKGDMGCSQIVPQREHFSLEM